MTRLPSAPVTLSIEQLDELNRKLSKMRHDIKNNLTVILGTAELIRLKPEVAPRMIVSLLEQPGRITQSMEEFTREFHQALGIPGKHD